MEAAIIFIVILIISVVIHELAHGYAAYALGDPTAKLAGRLSPNPAVHIDPLGSVIVPALMIIGSSSLGQMFAIGWAKPVPYNPYNLRDQKWGEAKIAAAGPAANLALATIAAALLSVATLFTIPDAAVELAVQIIFLNVFLALFNLLPLPPLDGSKILPPLLGLVSTNAMLQYHRFRTTLEQNFLLAFMVIIFVVIFLLEGVLAGATLQVTQALLTLFQVPVNFL